MDLPGAERGDVVRRHVRDEIDRLLALDDELTHVTHVEHTAAVAHHVVLSRDAAWVLDRHLEAGERDHLGPRGNVDVVERRVLERSGGACGHWERSCSMKWVGRPAICRNGRAAGTGRCATHSAVLSFSHSAHAPDRPRPRAIRRLCVPRPAPLAPVGGASRAVDGVPYCARRGDSHADRAVGTDVREARASVRVARGPHSGAVPEHPRSAHRPGAPGPVGGDPRADHRRVRYGTGARLRLDRPNPGRGGLARPGTPRTLARSRCRGKSAAPGNRADRRKGPEVGARDHRVGCAPLAVAAHPRLPVAGGGVRGAHRRRDGFQTRGRVRDRSARELRREPARGDPRGHARAHASARAGAAVHRGHASGPTRARRRRRGTTRGHGDRGLRADDARGRALSRGPAPREPHGRSRRTIGAARLRDDGARTAGVAAHADQNGVREHPPRRQGGGAGLLCARTDRTGR